MNARELALEMAALPAAQRDLLLSELPESNRAELQALIERVQPLLTQGEPDFEQFMADWRNAPAASSAQALGTHWREQTLSHLLQGESLAVRRRLIDVFARGQRHPLAERTHEVIADWLRSRSLALPPAPVVQPPRLSWRERVRKWLR